MRPVFAAAFVASALVVGCDQIPSTAELSEVRYRPGEPGSVDQAMCLLGFEATPLTRLGIGHQLVHGTLNGRPATFLLDTGANMSVVHAPHAEAFGLTPQTGVVGAAMGIGGTLRASRARVETLRLGDVDIEQRHLMLADLSQLDGMLGGASGETIHGIIGQDVMRRHGAVIDVSRSMLYVRGDDAKPRSLSVETCAAKDPSPLEREGPPELSSGRLPG